jgi:hypothetical protein
LVTVEYNQNFADATIGRIALSSWKLHMKKLLFFMPCFLCLTGFAQIRLELMGGYNDVNLASIGRLPFSAYHFPGGEYVPISSFHAGAGAEIDLGKKWFLEPALLYFGNGAHQNSFSLNPGISFGLDASFHLYYLRLPVNVWYKIVTTGSIYIFAGAGLYAARGIRGNEKGIAYTESAGRSPNEPVDSKVRFGDPSPSDTEPTVKPYDAGYTILAGIGWKDLQVRPSISNGLIKGFQGTYTNYANSSFAVSLVYRLPMVL